MWYRVLSLRFVHIRSLGIILIPYATFVPKVVFSFAPSIAELADREKSRTQSLTRLIWWQAITLHVFILIPQLPQCKAFSHAIASIRFWLLLRHSTMHRTQDTSKLTWEVCAQMTKHKACRPTMFNATNSDVTVRRGEPRTSSLRLWDIDTQQLSTTENSSSVTQWHCAVNRKLLLALWTHIRYKTCHRIDISPHICLVWCCKSVDKPRSFRVHFVTYSNTFSKLFTK